MEHFAPSELSSPPQVAPVLALETQSAAPTKPSPESPEFIGLPHSPPSTTVAYMNDESMSFAAGSLILLVGGVLFKIPKALLQRHSEGFGGMIEASHETEDPIPLSDKLEDFKLFREVLMNPLSSCLTVGHESNTTENLARLLIVANKYCASSIEELTLKQLIPLSKTITQPRLMIRLIFVANCVNSEELQESTFEELMKAVWAGKLDRADSISMLEVAKICADEKLLGLGHYAIARRSQAWWGSCRALNKMDRRRLLIGTARLAHEWQTQTSSWAIQGLGCDPDCVHQMPLFHYSTRMQAEKKVLWFDIVSKLTITIDVLEWKRVKKAGNKGVNKPCCMETKRSLLLEAKERVQDAMFDYFCDNDPVVDL